MESAAGQKALPTIAFKHTTAAATVASVSAPILLDIGRDLSPSPPRPAAGDAACCTALLPAITGGEHSLALPPSAYLSHQTPLQPQIPCRLQHVIANQCAHWCGNPHPRRGRKGLAALWANSLRLTDLPGRIAFRFVLPQEKRIAPLLAIITCFHTTINENVIYWRRGRSSLSYPRSGRSTTI